MDRLTAIAARAAARPRLDRRSDEEILGCDANGLPAEMVLETSALVAILLGDAEHSTAARAAWWRFGRGQGSASLSFGDLFSYALAVTTGRPLLFKGDDFSRTDVLSAR